MPLPLTNLYYYKSIHDNEGLIDNSDLLIFNQDVIQV